jgi:hypothetical protein
MSRHHPLARESRDQFAIGWQNFLCGHVAQSLIDYQEAYFRAREWLDTETGHTWGAKLIATRWTYFFAIWKLRCNERHAQDEHRVSKQHLFRVHARTQAVYASMPDLPVEIRSLHWFASTLDTQELALGLRHLEVWLAHTETLVKQGLAETAILVDTGHQDIRSYFQPITAPHPPPD